eukprot:TRINITY_DN2513_c0_g3_i1.p1 TRINITY_DN2513_c0_g3~~TRINITY_DN2513_c0_g3_i1.p1  ORF type:complete len:469 (+),score=66.48 TRINITY_DN2513_c0_g3_i1:64-1470(+)
MKYLIFSILLLCLKGGFSEDEKNVLKGFGMSMNINTAFRHELTTAFFNILDPVNYFEFADVSGPIKLFPLIGTVTLARIKLRSLRFTKKFAPADLIYVHTGDKGKFYLPESLVSMHAVLDCHVICPELSYNHKHSFPVQTFSSDLTFEFTFGTPTVTGLLALTWIRGERGSDPLIDAVDEVLSAKVFPKIGERVNRYLSLMVEKIVYRGVYKNMFVKSSERAEKLFSLKNEFEAFQSRKKDNKECIELVYKSSIYNAMEHRTTSLNATFTPSTSFTHPISLYLSHTHLHELYLQSFLHHVSHLHIMKGQTLKQYYGTTLKVRSLAWFYPKLAESFDLEARIEFACEVTGKCGKSVELECKFRVRETGRDVLAMDVVMGDEVNVETDKGETLILNYGSSVFKSITTRNVRVRGYLERQLLSFMQPMSKHIGKQLSLTLPLKDKSSAWKYSEAIYSPNKDITVYYHLSNS